MKKQQKRETIGPVMQKILLLLKTGISLSLSANPSYNFKIINQTNKEWKDINEQSLRRSIKKLFQSQLINYKEENDGTVNIVLNKNNKKIILKYDLETISIKTPKQWDYLWRIVMFDIPENKKQARNALSLKLKQLNFYPLQKSVFIYPYDCKNEIDFIIELFQIRPYIRFVIAKETDIDLKIKNHFKLK